MKNNIHDEQAQEKSDEVRFIGRVDVGGVSCNVGPLEASGLVGLLTTLTLQ